LEREEELKLMISAFCELNAKPQREKKTVSWDTETENKIFFSSFLKNKKHFEKIN
jgi:hypothetical protein